MASNFVNENEDENEPLNDNSTDLEVENEEENSEEGLRSEAEGQKVENDTVDHLNVEEDNIKVNNPINTAFNTVKDVSESVMSYVHESEKNTKDLLSSSIDKLSEQGRKNTKDVKEIFEDHAKKTSETHEQHQQKMAEKDKEHHKELKEYQFALQQASIEVTKYRTIEVIRNKIAQNALSFADAVGEYNQNIIQTKNNINRAKMKLQPFQNDLREVEMKMGSIESRYEELHHEFDKIIYSFEELKEQKESMKSAKYREVCKRKEKEIEHILDDIKHKELELLNRELDRLNKAEEMSTMLQEFEKHEIALECLESEHARLVSVGIHQMSNVQMPLENQNGENTAELIDVSSSDVPKTNNLLPE